MGQAGVGDKQARWQVQRWEWQGQRVPTERLTQKAGDGRMKASVRMAP